jgi:hypothetical protein
MAGFKSTYLANKLLDHWLGGPDFARPATLYIALFTAAPTASGGGTEVSGGSYARVAVTNNTTNFPAAASGLERNATAIAFPTATAGWGTVVGAGFFDASSGGNFLAYGPFTSSRDILSGETFTIAANGGTFTEA